MKTNRHLDIQKSFDRVSNNQKCTNKYYLIMNYKLCCQDLVLTM